MTWKDVISSGLNASTPLSVNAVTGRMQYWYSGQQYLLMYGQTLASSLNSVYGTDLIREDYVYSINTTSDMGGVIA